MSDLLRSALERMAATVDQFLSEAASVAGLWGELEERISDFATVITADQKAAREALAIDLEYEYRAMWDGKPQWPSRKTLGVAAFDLDNLRCRFDEPGTGHVERRRAAIKAGPWERVEGSRQDIEVAVTELLAVVAQLRRHAEYEYRAVVAEDNGNPEEFSPWDLREEEARRELARYLGPDHADAPYIVGWVERRLIVRPERMP